MNRLDKEVFAIKQDKLDESNTEKNVSLAFNNLIAVIYYV